MSDPRTCSSLCAQAQPRDEAALARELGDARALTAALSAWATRLRIALRRAGKRATAPARQMLPRL